MSDTKIRSFKELKNEREDLIEYLENIEWAYAQNFSFNESEAASAVEFYRFKTYRILFRQNLKLKTHDWYQELDSKIKNNWEKLTRKFLINYKVTLKNVQIKKFELKVQLTNLIEKNIENIFEYLDRADDLAVKLSFDDIDVEMTVLKEMKDESKKERVSFECHKDANYFYDMIKKLIKAVYSEVEKISSFDLSYKKSMQISLRNSEIITTNELLRQILINTNVAFLALLQRMRSLNTAVASDVSIAKSKITITASYSDKSQKQRKYKSINDIECYVCEQKDHYASAHRKKKGQRNEILAHAVISDQSIVSSKMILVNEEYKLSAMTTVQSQRSAIKQSLAVIKKFKIKKIAAAEKQKVRFDFIVLEREIHQNDYDEERELATSKDMKVEKNNELVLRESTFRANQIRKRLSQIKISKIEKVQKLMMSKRLKSTNSIRGMQSRDRFDISRILDLSLELTVEELLNRSDITIKDLTFNMQRSTLRYRIKRSKINVEDDAQEAENVQVSMTISAAILSSKVTIRTYEDDDLSKSLMINFWIETQRLSKSLLNEDSLMKLLNRKIYNKIKLKSRIRTDEYIQVSLINDFITTLREYVLISINVEEIEAVIKAWLIDVEVYDLLLRVFWLRRVHCNQKYDQSKIIIMKDDMTVRKISVQLMSVSTNLSVVELNEDDDWTTDEVCQHLLEKQEKAQFWTFYQRRFEVEINQLKSS